MTTAQAAVDSMILLPRFTSFAGATTFYTAPMNVRAYSHVDATFLMAGSLGSTGPAVIVTLEESPDLDIWYGIGSNLNNSLTNTCAFRFEWIRLKLLVTGTDPCFTCWCVGDFVRRHA